MPQDAAVGGYAGQSHCTFSVRNKVAGREGGSLYNRSGVSNKSRRKCQRGTEWLLRESSAETLPKGLLLVVVDPLMGSALLVPRLPRAETSLRGAKGLGSVTHVP